MLVGGLGATVYCPNARHRVYPWAHCTSEHPLAARPQTGLSQHHGRHSVPHAHRHTDTQYAGSITRTVRYMEPTRQRLR